MSLLEATLLRLSSKIVATLSTWPSRLSDIGLNNNREGCPIFEPQDKKETSPMSKSYSKHLLQLVTRSFTCILEGLDRLDKSGSRVLFEGQIVHQIVMIINSLLKQVGRLSSDKRANDLREKRTKSGENLSRENPVMDHEFGCDDAMSVCRLIIAITASLDTTKKSQTEILEGIMYLTLDRAGRILKSFVFDTILPPNNQLSEPDTLKDCVNQKITKATSGEKAEARYSIWTLERVMLIYRLSKDERSVNLSHTSGESTALPSEAIPSGHRSLANQAKMKLQKTLLTSVFGNNEFSFENRFRLPNNAQLKLNTELADIEELDVGKWFKQEVWRLLEWNVVESDLGTSRGA